MTMSVVWKAADLDVRTVVSTVDRMVHQWAVKWDILMAVSLVERKAYLMDEKAVGLMVARLAWKLVVR